MVESINFATYYRPTKFSEVVGQEVAVSVLKKIAAAPGISVRSVFLKGSYGSGKTTISRIFGRALNCKEFQKTGDVCNSCDGCLEAMAPNSQTYMEFDSSVAGNIDAIRSLSERLSYIPNGRRLVVFDEIHSASKAALNALLKLVEEGVPDTMFLFASTEDILSTLKSRSVCLDISTIPYELIVSRLKDICNDREIYASDDTLMSIALKSHGHMRDALSILQLYSLAGSEALASSYDLIVKFFMAAFSKRRDVATSVLAEILKFNVVEVRNSLNIFIRNIFLATSDSPLYKFASSGLNSKIYSYTFSPVSQQALKDEVGLELYFRSFLDKVCA